MMKASVRSVTSRDPVGRDPKRNEKTSKKTGCLGESSRVVQPSFMSCCFFVFVIIGDNILSFMVIDLVLYIFLMIQSSYKVYFY